MDDQDAGPSRSKRMCVDINKKKPLTEKELEELAETFDDSVSEFEFSTSESESEKS